MSKVTDQTADILAKLVEYAPNLIAPTGQLYDMSTIIQNNREQARLALASIPDPAVSGVKEQ
jgi:uncharacterized protein YjlB